MSLSAAATDFRSFQETKSRLWRSRWTMQVCTVACGKTAVIASGKPLQAVDDGNQHVLDAAVFQLVHDAQPELGALVLFEPQPQDFLAAVGAHAERDMDSLVAYQSFVADLDSQRVEKDQRVDRFQRPRLPGSHFLQHRVGYRADQIGRDLDPVELTQMADNFAGAHAAGVHRDDLVIKPRKAALVSGDQLRIETGMAVARHRQL